MVPKLLTLLSVMLMVFAVHEDDPTHSGDKTFNDGSGPEPEPEPEAEEEDASGAEEGSVANKTT